MSRPGWQCDYEVEQPETPRRGVHKPTDEPTSEDIRDEIARLFGFTPEEIFNCLGPSYIQAHAEAKARYEQERRKLIRRAGEIDRKLSDISDGAVRFDSGELPTKRKKGPLPQ